MNYPGERKWLTDWLAEHETRSDTFPYSIVLFAWSGDVPTWRALAGYLYEHDAMTYFRATAANIQSEARRIDRNATQASVVLLEHGKEYRVDEFDL